MNKRSMIRLQALPVLLLVCEVMNGFQPNSYLVRMKSVEKIKRSNVLNAKNLEKDEKEIDWKSILSPEAYQVLREEGTESPWSSPLNDIKEDGVFQCAGCKAPLFVTSTKFDSGTGWPSFTSPVDNEAIQMTSDYSLLIPRTECRCMSCDGHLGHVFPDGPEPTGLRFCMNGVAMEFISFEDMDEELKEEVENRLSKLETISLPKESVIPGVVLNTGVSFLFLFSFLRRINDLGTVFDFIPLLVAIYYGYIAVKDVMKATKN